ncbi:MAG: flagellar biosynthesis protein FliQ [Anaerolineae bacterium]
MSESFVMTLATDAMMLALLVSLPLLGVSLVVGLVVALFQAMTQINEMTLTFVPKFVAFGIVLMLLGRWMLQELVQYTAQLLDLLPQMVN